MLSHHVFGVRPTFYSRRLSTFTSRTRVSASLRVVWGLKSGDEQTSIRGWSRSYCSKNPPQNDATSNDVQGVIVSHNANNSISDELLSRLPPANLERPKTVVILLSKCFSHWIDGQFIKKTLLRLFPWMIRESHEAGGSAISVLATAVDRIPSPWFHVPSTTAERSLNARENGNANSSDDTDTLTPDYGVHGMAYWVSQSEHFLSNAKLLDEASSFKIESPRTIDFNFSADNITDDSTYSSIKVPLAQTLFYNEEQYTSNLSHWYERDVVTNGPMPSKHPVSHISLNLNPKLPSRKHSLHPSSIRDGGGSESEHALWMPLLPLTSLREVRESKGNVIKLLGKSDGSTLPASQELEAAVAEYFTTFQVEPQPVSVWAVVIPKDLHSEFPNFLEDTSLHSEHGRRQNGILTPGESVTLSQLLSKGAKIRRVLSGGGGWGDKAGLLTIDSADDYEDDRELSDLDSDDDMIEFPFFNNVAASGDFIAFYLPHNTNKDMEESSSWSPPEMKYDGITAVDLGVTPAADYDDVSSSDNTNSSEAAKFEHFAHRFGALSELGLGYRLFRAGEQNAMHRTKVDIPFARFSYQWNRNV